MLLQELGSNYYHSAQSSHLLMRCEDGLDDDIDDCQDGNNYDGDVGDDGGGVGHGRGIRHHPYPEE